MRITNICRLLSVALCLAAIICAHTVVAAAETDPRSLMSTNYASAYLGAKIAEQHKDARGASNLLKESRESYLNIPCQAEKKFFTIQLSREIEVNLIAISNLEFFSSFVKNFTIIGSRNFPCLPPQCMWRVLGHFQAQPVRKVQLFPVQRSSSVRYIRFLWVSHYGSEKSCTMTSLQVYGTDVLENFAADLNSVSVSDDSAQQVENLGKSFEALSHASATRPDSYGLPHLDLDTVSTLADTDISSLHEHSDHTVGDKVPHHPTSPRDKPAPEKNVNIVAPIFMPINLTDILLKIAMNSSRSGGTSKPNKTELVYSANATALLDLNSTNSTDGNDTNVGQELGGAHNHINATNISRAKTHQPIKVIDYLPKNATLKCRRALHAGGDWKKGLQKPQGNSSRILNSNTCAVEDRDEILRILNFGVTPIEWGYLLPVPPPKPPAHHPPSQQRPASNNPIIRLFQEVKTLQHHLAMLKEHNLNLTTNLHVLQNEIGKARTEFELSQNFVRGEFHTHEHDYRSSIKVLYDRLNELEDEAHWNANIIWILCAVIVVLIGVCVVCAALGQSFVGSLTNARSYSRKSREHKRAPSRSPIAAPLFPSPLAQSQSQSPSHNHSDSMISPLPGNSTMLTPSDAELQSSGFFEQMDSDVEHYEETPESDVESFNGTHAPRKSEGRASTADSEEHHRMLADMTDDTRASARDLSDVLGTNVPYL